MGIALDEGHVELARVARELLADREALRQHRDLLDAQEEAQLSVQILSRALTLVDQGGPRDDVRIGPHAARSEELRDGLEAAYRRWASTEADEQRRWSLVDRANEVRRWTLR